MGAAAPSPGGTVQAGRFTPEGSIPSPPTLTLTHNSYMRRRDNQKRPGLSYMRRVAEVNEIYDKYVRTGLSNREIWRRYIYPRFMISERAFYKILKASVRIDEQTARVIEPYLNFDFSADHS